MPPYPASFAQRGVWINELAGSGTAYQMPLAITFTGPLDVPALLAACRTVLERHPLLSAAFREEDGEIHIIPAANPPTISHGAPSPAPEFDVRRGPLARFTLTPLGPDRHRLLFVAHHLVFDGMSKDILVGDLAAAYAGHPLPAVPVVYGQAVAAERERVQAALAEAAVFWKERWRDPARLFLPGGPLTAWRRPGPGASLQVLTELPDVSEWGVTPFELLVAALHALMYRYGDSEPITAIDLSTRRPETAGVVGLFVNELPVSSRPSPEITLGEHARRVRRELRAIYAFREVPLAKAVEGLTPRGALTPVSISYRRRGADPHFPGLTATVEWAMSNGATRGPLHLQAVEGPGVFEAWFRYDPRVVGEEVAMLVAADLRAVLASGPETPLAALALPSQNSTALQEAVVSTASQGRGVSCAPAAEHGEAAVMTVPAELIEAVCGIWREALQLDYVGPEEDLFDLGGHSISILQIISSVNKRYGVELPMEVFFDNPTALGTAEAIARALALADA